MNKLTVKEKNDIQVMCHYVGREEFLRSVVQILYHAGDDMEDIDKNTAENYSDTATALSDLLDDLNERGIK